jgi:Xaa-Pro aminopeptidase
MVPKQELARRKNKLQIKLLENQIDGVLLAQNMSAYYHSGTMQCQYVYVPSVGDALGLVRKNMARANDEAGIAMVAMGGFSGLPGLLAKQGFSPKRLGLELDILPTTLYFRLEKTFVGVEIVDCSTAVREVRQVKSTYELEQMDAAARQSDTLHRQIPALLYDGKEELALAAECEAILRTLGHQGAVRLRGFGQEMFFGHLLSGATGALSSFLDSPTGGMGISTASPQGAGRKAIRSGEPITLDFVGIYNGYIVDQTRLYSLGSLPDALNRAFEAALLVQDVVKALLQPGCSGGEIYAAALETAKKEGLDEHFMGVGDTQAKYVGHGVGLELDEFPILAKGSSHVLAENMVVAVEPKFTFPGLGVVGIENTWHIQARGVKKISITPDQHVIV